MAKSGIVFLIIVMASHGSAHSSPRRSSQGSQGQSLEYFYGPPWHFPRRYSMFEREIAERWLIHDYYEEDNENGYTYGTVNPLPWGDFENRPMTKRNFGYGRQRRRDLPLDLFVRPMDPRREVKEENTQIEVFEYVTLECPKVDDVIPSFSCPSPDREGRVKCITTSQLCDSHIDCPFGEDEHPASCLFYRMTKAQIDFMAGILRGLIEENLALRYRDFGRKTMSKSGFRHRFLSKPLYRYVSESEYGPKFLPGYTSESKFRSSSRSKSKSKSKYGSRSKSKSKSKYGSRSKSKSKSKYGSRSKSKSKSKYKSRSKSKFISRFGYQPKSKSNSRFGYKPKSKFDSRFIYQPKFKFNSRFGYKPKSKSNSMYGYKPKSKSNSKYGYKPKFKFNSRFGYKPKSKSKSKYGYKPKSKSKSKYGYKPKSKSKSKYGYKPKSKSNSKYGYKPKSNFNSRWKFHFEDYLWNHMYKPKEIPYITIYW